ncbi:MAG: hypothetical protein KC636_27220, partial [Myxococcales bacterium]|nr:hypothetical protein [Myxococcales bacterium]
MSLRPLVLFAALLCALAACGTEVFWVSGPDDPTDAPCPSPPCDAPEPPCPSAECPDPCQRYQPIEVELPDDLPLCGLSPQGQCCVDLNDPCCYRPDDPCCQ